MSEALAAVPIFERIVRPDTDTTCGGRGVATAAKGKAIVTYVSPDVPQTEATAGLVEVSGFGASGWGTQPYVMLAHVMFCDGCSCAVVQFVKYGITVLVTSTA